MSTVFSDPETEVEAFPHATKPAIPRAQMATEFPTEQDEQDAPSDSRPPGWEPKPATTDQDSDPDDEAGEGDAEPAKPRRRWDPRDSGTRPTYWDHRPDPRRSGIDWWRHLRTPSRHGLYNGTALACGWYLEIPQWVTHQTAYLVDNWGVLTDVNTYFWSCAVVAVGVFDHQTRRLLWPLALLCRVPAVCLVVGVLLYGSPAPLSFA